MDGLLALLRDATATNRPALTLTDARVVEILGFAPGATWWSANAPAIVATGWEAEPLPTKGWVRFAPTTGSPRKDVPDAVDVRVVITWSPGPGAGPGLFRRQNAHGRIQVGESLELATEAGIEGAAVATAATAWISGVRTELDLSDENARRLAVSAAYLAS